MQLSLEGYAELKLTLDQEEVAAFVWVSVVNGELDDWGDAILAASFEPIAWQSVMSAYEIQGSTFELEHEAEILRQSLVGFWPKPPLPAGARPGLSKAPRPAALGLKSVG